MNVINTLFGIPLGYVMHFCWQLVRNYGVSIILFTIITKMIMFPLSLISQKNSIAMIKMRPLLDDIKLRHAGNSAEIAEKQKALYKKEHYSTLKGMLPLLIQIPIILGLINVIYHPMQHLLHLDPDTIRMLLDKTAALLHTTAASMGTGAQLSVLEAVQAHPEHFAGMTGIDRIIAMDLNFLGVSMAEIPKLLSLTVVYPILSGVSALLLGLYQNRHNVLQRVQGAASRWGMTLFLVAFSAFFACILPCGVGLYWITGNLLSIPVQTLCNKIYDPGEYARRVLRSARPKPTPEEKKAERLLKQRKRQTQRKDRKRFAGVKNKQLVFYSESSGFYKYFEGFINYVLEHSDVVIHYVTSDIDDQIFSKKNPRIQTYYIGPIALIRFMMLLDADMVVMTMPDLEQYQIKRSLVRKDIEYVYLDHGMTSFHLMLREGALDYFDTIFCYGPNHIQEVRETERVYGLPAKNLVKTGFPLLDTMLKAAGAPGKVENNPKKILIAPSWQIDNILELCPDEVIRPLLGAGYRVIVRPHPEFVKRFPDKVRALIARYRDAGSNFEFQTSFASNETVYTADLVITDWSSIANEFSYATKKPSLFINTPMKIMNPNYKKIPCVPLDLSLRDEIGVSMDVDQLDTLPVAAARLLGRTGWYRERISGIVSRNIYDVGDGARRGGEYIVRTLEEKKKRREEAERATSGSGQESDDPEGCSAAETLSADSSAMKDSIDYLPAIASRLDALSMTPRISGPSPEQILREPVTLTGEKTQERGAWILELLNAAADDDVAASAAPSPAASASAADRKPE